MARPRRPRSRARRVAVEVLYAADIRGVSPELLLEERRTAGSANPAYACHLVCGVDERRAQIDEVLAASAPTWPVERMSAVDRNVLRLAVLEILEGETPAPVVIDEAVELAKRWSGDDAGKFVNGVLSGVLRAHDAGRVSDPDGRGESE